MKSSLMRTALAVALALGLTACGGKATFPITGSVNNLLYDGLVLESNGQTVTVPKASATVAARFSFPNTIEYGQEYKITVNKQPAHETCTPDTAAVDDVAGRLEKIDVSFTCTLVSPQLVVTINGLAANGLVLTNGSISSGPLNGTTASDGTVTYPASYTFPPVQFGSTYGVTVLTQPSVLPSGQPKAQTCTVANGAGTVTQDDNITNITVTCGPQ
jgi:hypothetical protein